MACKRILYGRKCLASLEEQQKKFLENQKDVNCKPRKVDDGVKEVKKVIKKK